MSAIATKTNSFVKLLEGTNTKIHTRKTTPGFRVGREVGRKWVEERITSLLVRLMLKDNHIDFAGGIACWPKLKLPQGKRTRFKNYRRQRLKRS
jgi:nicotinate-nucleotide pyrophosphorylase (carboxylating)